MEDQELKTEKFARLKYDGSLLWLIFWMIIFFPIALILLFIKSSFRMNETTYQFKYDGNPFWLMFWVVFFFPITFILLLLNGVGVVKTIQKPKS